MKRFHRVLFFAFSGLIWLGVAWLVLEFAFMIRIAWIERHNVLILAARGEVAGPLPGYPPPPCHEEGVFPDRSFQPKANRVSTEAATLPSWAAPRAQESDEARDLRRSAFASLDEEQRNLFALVNDEIVVRLDAARQIAGVYGTWLIRTPFEAGLDVPMLARLEERVLKPLSWPLAQERVACTVDFSEDPAISNRKRILVLRDPDTGAYVFIPGDLKTVQFLSLSPESPWDGIPFFRYKANLRNSRSGLGILFDTNNYGFRDRDIATPKPAGLLRVLCVGGSTTEEGVTNDTTYPKFVEQTLNAGRAAAAPIEVINCGISGMTTSGHLARLADYLELEPDWLIFYEGVNDIHRDLVEYWRVTAASPRRRALAVSRFVRFCFNDWLYPGDEEIRAGVRGLAIENLRAMARVARSRGVRVAICSVAGPDPAHLSDEERAFFDYSARAGGLDPCLNLATYARILGILNEEIRTFCDREGVLYIPVAEYVQGGYALFTDLYHMNEAGIRCKARIVSDCLRPNLPS